ncbi:MAG: Mur ligase family protein, partial [Acidimicrobiales bacterium]
MTAPGRTLIAGFGVTGRAVARALVEDGELPAVVEDRPDAAGRDLAASLGLALVGSSDRDALRALVGGVDRVVPSPGLPPHHPVLTVAVELGVPVVSEIEVAWERLTGPAATGGSPRLVAITGTNGKTTVTTLVAAILRAGGRRAESAGNIGRPLIDLV